MLGWLTFRAPEPNSLDVSGSQIITDGCSVLSSVAITQTTPGDVLAAKIFHAVSFDGALTYKVYISSTWIPIVQYINGTTWQYNSNTGTGTTWSNATVNTLSQAMKDATLTLTGHQWEKTAIEAMSSSDWMASNGWSTDSRTIDWAYTTVNGTDSNGANNSSTTNACSVLSSDGTTALFSSERSSTYAAWKAFDGLTSAPWEATSGTYPMWVGYNFGSAVRINKFQYYSDVTYYPTTIQFHGSSSSTFATYTTLYPSTNVSTKAAWSGWLTFSCANTYQYYRLYITAGNKSTYSYITELQMVEAAQNYAPTYTKTSLSFLG